MNGYQLYRLAQPTDDVTDGVLLGTFDGFDEALAARDADTVELFSATGPGQVLHAHHQILGPGILGPITAHPVITEIERSASCDPRDVAEARAWLATIHRSA
jgi:hypothetical protein